MPRHRPLIISLAASLLLGSLSVAAPSNAPLVSVPRFTHPGAGQVFYFILTDRFANGSTANDTGGIVGGRDDHGFDPTAISHYHGGDFVGLTAQLDYLKRLGATAVWVTPPFKNKAVQSGTAAYHGYWILDFLQIDPHLGTDAEFREFVRQAHARGLRVFLDIIVNHTADVIAFEGGETAYRSQTRWPYRDAQGRTFDERALAYNGVGPSDSFPKLDPSRSFPYVPVVTPAETAVKNPAWLNDLTLYHNRGNSTFKGENSLYGDFVGLDDLFTENPVVVRGFIDIYGHWLESYGVDGFRIDTAKHVNTEFWQAFSPAIRTRARELGRPDFLAFGEVSTETGDPQFLSEFSTAATLDATLDFGFFVAVRNFVSRGGASAAFARFFDGDDLYTDHDSNVHSSTTFVGNHDAGRFGYFLNKDNAGATDTQRFELMKLGHGLLFLARGQPVIYYGDEQGMAGTGDDMGAREDMFASQAKTFRALPLIGKSRTGADDKFDETHPLYVTFRSLAALRVAHPALARGAMQVRTSDQPKLFAFSRFERNERVEYLVAFNNSRTARVEAFLPTSQPPGATLRRVYDSRHPEQPKSETITIDARGRVGVALDPLQFAVWRAEAPLAPGTADPTIAFTTPANNAALEFSNREADGLIFPSRQELRAEVAGSDGVAEVTFVMIRASRPDQYELLGTDDAPPYRVYWRPTADLAPGEELTFVATVDDLRGRRASTQVSGVKIAPAAPAVSFGIKGSRVPVFTRMPDAVVEVPSDSALTLNAGLEGTEPLEYQWLRNGAELPGATDATLTLKNVEPVAAGSYSLRVRNLAGTVLSRETVVRVGPGR